MLSDSSKRPVLITGASTGIGKKTAHYLDEMGFQVFAGVRYEKDGEVLKNHSHKNITPVILDITRKEDIVEAFKLIETHTGSMGLYGLINNAGIPFGGPLEFVDIEQLRRVMEVNLFGAISVTQAFLPLIRKGKGRIINVSSISGKIALPFIGPYAASKFALEAVSDSLRVELKPWKIPVSIIEPGDVSTPIWEKAAESINQTISSYPQIAHDHYGPIFDKINAIVSHGIPAYHVAQKIYKALTVKWPKARYLVGVDARIASVVTRLPPIIRDSIIRQFLPEYGGNGNKVNEKRP